MAEASARPATSTIDGAEIHVLLAPSWGERDDSEPVCAP